jgi:predicted  nucleic acid-binding Zn-ribbon protein
MTPEQQIEIRLAALEEARNIFNNFNAHQMLQNRETNENLAILLGIGRSQERDLKAMQADIGSLKNDVAMMQVDLSQVKERLSTIESRLTSVEVELHTGFASMNERFDAIMALLSGNQPKPPEP